MTNPSSLKAACCDGADLTQRLGRVGALLRSWCILSSSPLKSRSLDACLIIFACLMVAMKTAAIIRKMDSPLMLP